ncbi:hypothetical protein [Actinomadura luteofluorescens]|uniref:hypothetical protein n=1 Tax=Actinomadura luteofluorescens TaxID=46163 RepID=UPI0030D53825
MGSPAEAKRPDVDSAHTVTPAAAAAAVGASSPARRPAMITAPTASMPATPAHGPAPAGPSGIGGAQVRAATHTRIAGSSSRARTVRVARAGTNRMPHTVGAGTAPASAHHRAITEGWQAGIHFRRQRASAFAAGAPPAPSAGLVIVRAIDSREGHH